jgi:hypothetical protein
MNVLGYNIYYAWDLLGLYRQIWGHVGIPYSKVSTNDAGGEVSEGGSQVKAWDGNSLDGLQFRESSLKGGAFLMPLTIDGYKFPIEPLVSVSGSKHIVETKITGVKMPIVEEVAMETYKVTIKGVYINEENDNYPYREVARLPWLLEKRGALPVVNELLRVFGIDYLVIKDIRCDGIEGHQSMQWYVIEAVATRPLELEIKEGAQ